MAACERLRSMKTWLIAAMLVGALLPLAVAAAQVTVTPVIDARDATDVVATRPDISFAFEVANNSAKKALTGLGTTVGSALSLNSLVSSYALGRVGGAA